MSTSGHWQPIAVSQPHTLWGHHQNLRQVPKWPLTGTLSCLLFPSSPLPPPPLHQCYLLSSILMCLLPWRWLFAGYSSSICSVPSPYLPRLNLHTKLSLYQLTFPQGSIYLNRNLGIQIALDRWFIFSLMDDNTSCSGNGSKRVVVKVSKRCSFLQFN